VDDIIKQVGDQLSRIFRHMLPGLCVIGAAYAAQPTWFQNVQTTEGWHAALLGAAAFASGNIWYVLHRYTIHQFIDVVLFYFRRIFTDRQGTWSYLTWLARYVDRSFESKKSIPDLREHLHFRSAQVILMFIVSEVILVFSFWPPEQGSFFAVNQSGLRTIGFVLFACAFIQYIIGETVDRAATKKHGAPEVAPKKNPEEVKAHQSAPKAPPASDRPELSP